MTQMVIKDGHGTGRTAEVDDHGRLAVIANTITHDHHHAIYHENLFNVYGETVLQGATETPIFHYAQNDSTKKTEIYRIFVASNANLEVSFYVKDAYSSGGTALTPTNMTVGSGNRLDGVFYAGGASGDLAVTTARREQLSKVFIPAFFAPEFHLDGSLIIKNGGSVTVTAKGTADDVVTVNMIMAEHGADERF